MVRSLVSRKLTEPTVGQQITKLRRYGKENVANWCQFIPNIGETFSEVVESKQLVSNTGDNCLRQQLEQAHLMFAFGIFNMNVYYKIQILRCRLKLTETFILWNPQFQYVGFFFGTIAHRKMRTRETVSKSKSGTTDDEKLDDRSG